MITVLVPDSVNSVNVSQDVIDELIACPKYCKNKKIKRPTVRNMHQNTHYDLESTDHRHTFEVIVRQSIKFEEDFSIILRYKNLENEWSLLFRCNSMHSGEPISEPLHNKFHTHKLAERDWKRNSRVNPVLRSEAEYSNFAGAIAFFGEHCKIPDIIKFFPEAAKTPPIDENQIRIEDLELGGDGNGDQPCGADQ